MNTRVILQLVLCALLSGGCSSLTPLQNAIVQGNTKKAIQLAGKAGDKIDARDGDGRTALFYASNYCQLGVAEAILGAGADPNLSSDSGSTPLIEAAYDAYPEMVTLLLEHGAEPDLPYRSDGEGSTPLMWGVRENSLPVVLTLIAHDADIDKPDKDGTTPLMLATMEDHRVIAKHLLRLGAQPNRRDSQGRTALHFAAAKGQAHTVERLLVRGADPNEVTGDGSTAASLAGSNGFTDVVKLIENWAPSPRSGNEAARPTLVFRGWSARNESGDMLPSWGRSRELRISIGDLLDLLDATGEFQSIEVGDAASHLTHAMQVELSIDESDNRHVAANVTRAFFSGLLTLGLIPPKSEYSYKSTMTMTVRKGDGTEREYQASASSTGEWVGDPRYNPMPMNTYESTRKAVTFRCYDLLVAELISDAAFFKGPS